MAVKKPAERPNASKDDLLKYYREMLLIRRFEEKAGQLYGMGFIGGFCHLYIGQEAVVVGMQMAQQEGDQVITAYRDHGHMLAAGLSARGVMAELTGRRSGLSKGKGGSMHMFSKEKHFYGGHGIVAAQVPLGAGLAMSDWYKGNDNVTFTYFGDGAANQGQVYETFNMAALWKLPIIFVVENNGYAMGTAVKRGSAETEFYRRGTAFRIPGMDVNGMDVLEVRQAAEVALEYVRAGNGPVLMELKTYRYRGHSMSDPAKYRTREEVEKMRSEKDAIEHVRDLLLQVLDYLRQLPKPYVKWACEPARAEDVPLALARAYHLAMQPPCGPVFVSIPADDWDKPSAWVPPRTVTRSIAPDPEAIRAVAKALQRSKRPAIVAGTGVDRDGAVNLLVSLAEQHRAAKDALVFADIGRRGVLKTHFTGLAVEPADPAPEGHPGSQGFFAAMPLQLR